MSLSDTAEYWADVKSASYKPYLGKQYYHIPNALCGRKHWNLARRIDDVNCTDCLNLINTGYEHNLPEGKTDFRSRKDRMRDEGKESHKKWLEKQKEVIKPEKTIITTKCSCGAKQILRKNSVSEEAFLGCSTYPKCKKTTSLKE